MYKNGSKVLFQYSNNFQQTRFVFFGKTTDGGAVNVQNTPDFSVYMDGKDDFGVGGTVTGNMAGKGMDIRHAHDSLLPDSYPAHPFSDLDPYTGCFSLKRSENKFSVRHFIKTGPIQIRKMFP